MVVLIWWWVPLCESCSSELHWLVVSFEMAAMDPESLFLLYWFRGSICGLPHYCSQFSKSTFCSTHRSVCLGSDVVAQSIEYTLTCSPLSRSCCGIDRFSYPHSYAIYETPTCPRLFLPLILDARALELRAHGAVQSSWQYNRNLRAAAKALNSYERSCAFQTSKPLKQNPHKWRLTVQFPSALGGFLGKFCQLLCQRPWAEVQGHHRRWPPELGVKWPVNRMQHGAVLVCKSVCVSKLYKAVYPTQCTQDQPGHYACSLCSLTDVYVFFNASISMCMNVCESKCVFVCVCAQVTLKLPDQMCRSLDCAEWWVAPSLTLQTLNNAHRSLQLMSSLYKEPTLRALPTVSIRSSIAGEWSVLGLRWRRTKELDAKCKSASGTWGGSSFCLCHKAETDSFPGSGWSTFRKAEAARLFFSSAQQTQIYRFMCQSAFCVCVGIERRKTKIILNQEIRRVDKYILSLLCVTAQGQRWVMCFNIASSLYWKALPLPPEGQLKQI